MAANFAASAALALTLPELFRQALIGSLAKFSPRANPQSSDVRRVGRHAGDAGLDGIQPELFGPTNVSRTYNGVVTFVLALTVWFANFAEALAEGCGKQKRRLFAKLA